MLLKRAKKAIALLLSVAMVLMSVPPIEVNAEVYTMIITADCTSFVYDGQPHSLTGVKASVDSGTKTLGVVSIPESGYKFGSGNVTYWTASGKGPETNVGNYKCTVTQKVKFGVSKFALDPGSSGTLDWSITPASITSVTLDKSNGEYLRTGSAITPSLTVKAGDLTLSSSDYDVSGTASATDAGTYTVTVTGKGNFQGSKSATYKIVKPAEITDSCVTLAQSEFTYDGTQKSPTVKVTVNGTELTKGTHYYLASTEKATRVGNFTVCIGGIGEYEGTVYKDWKILPKNINDITFTPGTTSYSYTGQDINREFTLKFGDYTLKEGDDYTIEGTKTAKSVGNYTLKINGTGNYTGTIETNWSIAKATPNPSVTAKTLTYNGKAQELVNGSTNLGTIEYTTSAEKYLGKWVSTKWSTSIPTATDAGTYTVHWRVPGTDDWDSVGIGTVGVITYITTDPVSVTIQPAKIKSVELTDASKSQLCTGSDLTAEIKSVTVECDGADVTLASSEWNDAFTVSDNKASSVGTHTLKITGKGNYTGTATADWTITKAPFTSANVTLTPAKVLYKEVVVQKPSIKVEQNDETLKESTDGGTTGDYTVKYVYGATENTVGFTDIGSYKVAITGINDYAGSTATLDWDIVSNDINNGTVTVAESNKYTGSAVTPETSVVVYGVNLVAGTDFKATYAERAKASDDANFTDKAPSKSGEYTVKITGIGDYSGTVVKNFTIGTDLSKGYTAKLVKDGGYTWDDVKFWDLPETAEYVYDGSAHTPTIYVRKNYESVADILVPRLQSGTDYSLEGVTSATLPGKVGDANVDTSGRYIVTVKGEGAYYGSIQRVWVIKGLDIADAEVTVSESSYQYDGEEKTPSVTVKYDTKTTSGVVTLTAGTDYTLSGDLTKKDVDTYTITITGGAGYTGTKTANWEITPGTITVTADGETEWPYDEAAHCPVVVVKNQNGTVLTESTDGGVTGDYVLSGDTTAQTSVKKYSITATGINGYAGSTSDLKWAILDNNIEHGTTTIEKSNKYTGSAVTPEIKLVIEDKTLTAGQDYKVSYSKKDADNYSEQAPSESGKYTAKIEGIAPYTGTVKKDFTIGTDISSGYTAKLVKDGGFTWDDVKFWDLPETAEYVYDGTTHTPTVYVRKSRESITDYLTARLEENDDYTLGGVTSAKTPGVVGADYVVAEGAHEGYYIIKIEGKGAYYGSMTREWVIKGVDIKNAEVTVKETSYQYDNTEKTPTVTVKYNTGTTSGTVTLKESEDYELTGATTKKAAGTHTITVKGKGGYVGTKDVTWTITGLITASAATTEWVYDGKTGTTPTTRTPSVVVKNQDGNELTKSTDEGVTGDYVLSGDLSASAIGNYTITATGVNEYVGSEYELEWSILDNDITNGTITISKTNAYTGSAVTPETNVVLGNKTLEAGSDYIVTYYKRGSETALSGAPTESGKYTAKISGAGETSADSPYIGSVSKDFTIGTDISSGYAVKLVKDGGYTWDDVKFWDLPETAEYVYDKTERTPTVYVRKNRDGIVGASTARLEAGKDYELLGITSAKLPGDPDSESEYVVKTGDHKGYYIIKVAGKGAYYGSTTREWVIKGADISSSEVTVTEASYVYDGDEKTPEVAVKYVSGSSDYLVAGTDYALDGDTSGTGAAQYSIVIKGKNGYTGTKYASWEITRNDPELSVSDPGDKLYTAEAQSLVGEITFAEGYDGSEEVKYTICDSEGTEIVKDKLAADAVVTEAGTYTVSYSIDQQDNWNADEGGSYTVKIIKLEDAITFTEKNEYTGDPVDPVKVTINDRDLSKGTDYTCEYYVKGSEEALPGAPSESGEYTVVITSAYGEIVTKDFTIGTSIAKGYIAKLHEDGSWTEDDAEFWDLPETVAYSFDTKEHAPTVYVRKDRAEETEIATTKLVEGTDYAISGDTEATMPGDSYELVIEGKGAYYGKLTRTWKLNAAKLSDCEIELSEDSYKYDGTDKTPSIKLTFDTKTDAGKITLEEGVDYTVEGDTTNKTLGTHTITVVAQAGSGFTGTADAEWTIGKGIIKIGATTQTEWTYDGTAHAPTVVVKNVLGDVLTEGVDYELSGGAKTDAGKYTVTASGINNYEGSKSKLEWKIVKATPVVSIVGYGKGSASELTFSNESKALVKSVAIASKENANVDLMKLGAAKIQYQISSDGGKTWSKASAEAPKAKDAGVYLIKYSVEASNNCEAYAPKDGSNIIEVEILPMSVEKENPQIRINVVSTVFNNKEQTPDLTVKSGDDVLVAGVDYEYSIKRIGDAPSRLSSVGGIDTTGLHAGLYEITIKGIGNCIGEQTFEWLIERAEASIKLASDTIEKTQEDEPFAIEYDKVGDSPVTFESSDSKVASVDEDGNVTLGESGSATITLSMAESQDYFGTTAELTVNVKAVEEDVEPEEDPEEEETEKTKTGDQNDLIPLAGLMALALAGAGILLRRKED